jgi:hypothetical protein
MGDHRDSRCSAFVSIPSWEEWESPENYRLLLVRCLELLPIWSWTDDSNSPRRSDDHWSRHLFILPLCLQTIRSPLQVVLQNRVHKLGAYLNQHLKTKGPVTEKEYTAFLNLWLKHFLCCGPSLAPTKNYLPLAYELAKGNTVGLGKLFLGEVYRYLHLMSLSLLTQKKIGPVVPGGLSNCGLTYTFRTSSQTSLFWPITLSQIRVGGGSDVPASARLYVAFLVASCHTRFIRT